MAGIVSASSEAEYATLDERLPGLHDLYKSPLARRELSLAWQHGFTILPGKGMVHATSMLAPLYRHDRVNDRENQTAITIHDVVPWTNPETLTPRGVRWHKGMAARAFKYADAVVVPTHAVAVELAGFSTSETACESSAGRSARSSNCRSTRRHEPSSSTCPSATSSPSERSNRARASSR